MFSSPPTLPTSIQNLAACGRAVSSQVRKFGQPDAGNYTLVFDGDLGTSDLEQIYTICRDAPPPGYQGYRMALSDVVELYDDSVSEFYYCDRVGFQPIRFEQKQDPCINMTL